MSENNKNGSNEEPLTGKKSDEGKENSWSEDQKIRGYYYDDACGYEIYRPDEDEEPEDE